MTLTHLSLFSGIGGLDLAAEWAGFTTVGQCEMADYPTKILKKHWPNVPRWRDIRTLTKESFHERTGLRTVDIISGGFPCQPFSVAGKQKGKGDDRYLWPEMRRVISELEPRWVVGENVPGILRIAAADVIADLEGMGFHVLLLDFEAASVGAPHHRERIAFVANRDGVWEQPTPGSRSESWDGACNSSSHVANTNSGKLRHDSNNWRQTDREEHETANSGDAGREKTALAYAMRNRGKAGVADQTAGEERKPAVAIDRCKTIYYTMRRVCRRFNRRRNAQGFAYRRRWPAEPDVGRVAHGVPHRVDRVKGLGNAVCPPQFYPIFAAIADWERTSHT